MIKSNISFAHTALGWTLLDGNRVIEGGIATRKETRKLLRLARAAERVAVAQLKGREASNGGRATCDVRCTSAHGPVCSCSCMGQNHQADLAA